MSKKVILILVDGMRPDSLKACGHPFIEKVLSNSSHALHATTVMPSVTLPCHMSLFHSVDPTRHGINTNTYTPQVRPIKGLCEQLMASKKNCAFFYNWEELRDLARPGSLAYSCYISGDVYSYEKTNAVVTQKAIEYIKEESPDFLFLYLGFVDWAGHKFGWMSDEYNESVSKSWDCIENVMASLPKEYTTIITADHGGHDRGHGSDLPEDMLIPIIINGDKFKPNYELIDVNIKDIAPTITTLLEVATDSEWEGKSLL